MPTFRVVTWNVENLFLPAADAGPDTAAIYEEKVNNLASVLRNLHADVVALQEVGGEEPLDDLRRAAGYSRSAAATPDARGIRVAFLAQQPFRDVTEIGAFPPGWVTISARPTESMSVWRMGRAALSVTVSMPDGRSVHIVNAHLKSKLITYPSTGKSARFEPRDEYERSWQTALALHRRTDEAVALRNHASGLLAADEPHPVVLAGDLNDVTAAATTQILQGPTGSELKTPGAARPDAGDDQRLWNLAPLLAAGRDYSRVHKGKGELIDHIFVSRALAGPGHESSLVSSEPAYDAVVDAFDAIPSIADDPRERRNQTTPDHAPMVATFDLQ